MQIVHTNRLSCVNSSVTYLYFETSLSCCTVANTDITPKFVSLSFSFAFQKGSRTITHWLLHNPLPRFQLLESSSAWESISNMMLTFALQQLGWVAISNYLARLSDDRRTKKICLRSGKAVKKDACPVETCLTGLILSLSLNWSNGHPHY